MYACRVLDGAALGPASNAACVISRTSEIVSSGDLSRMVRLEDRVVAVEVEDRVDMRCVACGAVDVSTNAELDTADATRIKAAIECFIVLLLTFYAVDFRRYLAGCNLMVQ